MLNSPHTSAPMLMRGNALVLKTPVENAPRTSIEKQLSWSSDDPPAARFPLYRSRAAEYPPNRPPATVSAEERGGRDTTSRLDFSATWGRSVVRLPFFGSTPLLLTTTSWGAQMILASTCTCTTTPDAARRSSRPTVPSSQTQH